MAKDILARMKERAPSFTKGQRAIAGYILDTFEKAAFLTAGRLGRAVGVSESTVVRFAMELGYDGYPSMQKELQELVLKRLTAVQRMEVAQDRLKNQDVVDAVLEADMEKIRKTQEKLDRKDFQAAVHGMLRARKLYILGARSSAPLASFFGFYLGYMFRNVQLITTASTAEVCEQLVGIGPEDWILAFSFPRYSASTGRGACFGRSRGATVVGITDNRESPVGQCADLVLCAKSDMLSMVDSLVAPLSLVNALLVAIAAHRGKELTETCGQLEPIWERYDVYEQMDGE